MSEFTNWLKNRDRKMYSEMAAMLGGDDPLDVHHQEMGKASEAEKYKIASELRNKLIPDLTQRMMRNIDTNNIRLWNIDFNYEMVKELEKNLEFLHPNNLNKMLQEPAKVKTAALEVDDFLENLQHGHLGVDSASVLYKGVDSNKRDANYLNKLKSMVLNPLNFAWKALDGYRSWQP